MMKKFITRVKRIRFHTNDLTKKVLETAYKESINNSVGILKKYFPEIQKLTAYI